MLSNPSATFSTRAFAQDIHTTRGTVVYDISMTITSA